MNISLQIIVINIYSDDFRIFRKLMNFRTNLTGAKGNAKTNQQVTFRIGDHIGIAMSVSASDASKIQRIVPR